MFGLFRRRQRSDNQFADRSSSAVSVDGEMHHILQQACQQQALMEEFAFLERRWTQAWFGDARPRQFRAAGEQYERLYGRSMGTEDSLLRRLQEARLVPQPTPPGPLDAMHSGTSTFTEHLEQSLRRLSDLPLDASPGVSVPPSPGHTLRQAISLDSVSSWHQRATYLPRSPPTDFLSPRISTGAVTPPPATPPRASPPSDGSGSLSTDHGGNAKVARPSSAAQAAAAVRTLSPGASAPPLAPSTGGRTTAESSSSDLKASDVDSTENACNVYDLDRVPANLRHEAKKASGSPASGSRSANSHGAGPGPGTSLLSRHLLESRSEGSQRAAMDACPASLRLPALAHEGLNPAQAAPRTPAHALARAPSASTASTISEDVRQKEEIEAIAWRWRFTRRWCTERLRPGPEQDPQDLMFQAILEGQTADLDPLVNAARRLMEEQSSPTPRVSSSATLSESLIFSESGTAGGGGGFGTVDGEGRRLARKYSFGRRVRRSGGHWWRDGGLYTRQTRDSGNAIARASVTDDWVGNHLTALDIAPGPRVTFALFKVCDSSGRVLYSVRGSARLEVQAAASALRAEAAAVAMKLSLPRCQVVTLCIGEMDWRGGAQPQLLIYRNRLKVVDGNVNPAFCATLAATVTQNGLASDHSVLVR